MASAAAGTETGSVVIAGAGQGGFQVAASLREAGFPGRIVLVGDEPGLPYQRPPLSKAYLLGETTAERLRFRQAPWYAEHRIELRPGERVVAVDRAARRVVLASGETLPYGHLVLATGARDRRLAVPGADLPGVMSLRTLEDADRLRPRLLAARDVAVVGAGFIGLEAAAVAARLGSRVHVVELAARPMARAVSPEISAFFHAAHAGMGTGILFSASVTRILAHPADPPRSRAAGAVRPAAGERTEADGPGATDGDGRVTGVETADGLRLPADLVVVGIGIVPNVELAAEAGLAVENGVVVDELLSTEDPAVSAIGDCAAFPCRHAGGARVRLESVQNAADQARCVAARLVGRPAPYAAVPWFWSDQGPLKLQMVGLTAGHDTAVLRGDPDSGSFSVFCFRGGRLVGVESVNRPADHLAGRRLLAGAADLTPAQVADPAFDLKAAVARMGRGG